MSNPIQRVLLIVGLLFCCSACRNEQAATLPAQTTTPPSASPEKIVLPKLTSRTFAQTRSHSVAPSFIRVDADWGIHFERYDDQRGQHRILEANGGGVAIADFDLDGKLEILFTDGCVLPLKSGDREHRTRMYRDCGTLWSEFSESACLMQFGYSGGCATGDVNGDGFEDLYIAAVGPNALWINNGDGTFQLSSETGTVAGHAWSASVAFGDLNRDGHLDLYVTNYVDTNDDPPRLCPIKNAPDGYMQCAPTVFEAADDSLYLSRGDGRFADVSASSGIRVPYGKGLGVVVVDTNDDNWPDIYIANDGLPNFLFINDASEEAKGASVTGEAAPVVKFRDRGYELGAAVNFAGESEASMGVACGDVDGNGSPDFFLTHYFLEKNTLYLNQGRQAGFSFLDQSNEAGLAAPSRPYLGFGTEFIDADNNGALDIFVANGHVDDFTWDGTGAIYQMPPQFFWNDGHGKFAEVSADSGEYFEGKWIGRGAALGDLNADGRLDLVISHQRSRSAVLINATPTAGRALTLQLKGTKSNRSAIGARVIAKCGERSLTRFVIGGGSFQSASSRDVHLGLGKETQADEVSVHWPSGLVQQLGKLAAGSKYLVIEEGDCVPSSFDR